MNHKKIFFAAACLVVFGFFTAPSTKAATVAEIQALIQQLSERIFQLQQQLSQATPVSWCHTFNTDLQIGNYNSEVLALETALQKEGFLIQADNYFDAQTAAAVVGFQEKYRSDVLSPSGLSRGTGFAGRATRAKLNSLYGCGNLSVSAPTQVSTYPYITVISPNGGETIFSSQISTISWRSSGISKVIIDVCAETPLSNIQYTCERLTGISNIGIDAASGYYQSRVDFNSPGQVKIRIYDANNPAVYDESDNKFTLIRSNETTTGSYSSKTAPGQITNLSVVNNAGYALLSWSTPNDGGSSIQNYRIYRGTSSGNDSFLTTTQFTNYTDSSVSRGNTYYYRVSAVNLVGESSLSNRVSVMIPSESFSDSGNAYVNITSISPSSVISGQNFLVNWWGSSHFQGCRVWFGGSNETKTNLPASGSVSFSTSGIPAGTYGISVRCFRPNEMDSMSNYNDSAYQSIGMAATSSVSITAANQTSTSASAFACGCVNGSATGTIARCSNVVNPQTFCMVQCTQQNKGYYDGSSFSCVDN